jgi:predicted MFS family arabinose efflux permease
VTALYVTGTVLGGLTGRLGAAVVADHLSWRWSFAFLAALTFAGAIAAWLLLPRSTRFQPQTDWRTGLATLFGHLHNGPLLATCFTGSIVLFSHVGLFTYINFYLARPPFSLSTSALGAMFLVYALGIIVTPLSGRLIDRTGHRAGAAASVALVIGGCLLLLLTNLPAIILGVAIASTGVFVGQSAASSHIGRTVKGARSAASGLYVSCYYLGGSVGATALVVPWRLGDWPAIVACIIAAQLVCFLLTWKFFARTPQHTTPLVIE